MGFAWDRSSGVCTQTLTISPALWTLASMCGVSWTATVHQTVPQVSSPSLCAAVTWILRRGEFGGGSRILSPKQPWGGSSREPPSTDCHPSPQALFRKAGTMARNASHALSWSPATGPTTGTTGAGLLGDLPAGRELTACPPRSPRLSLVGLAIPISTSGENTLTRFLSKRWPRHGTLSQGRGARPIPPDLPFPLMQGAPPQPLSASGPQVTRLHTHMVGHIALPYLPF